jgi:heme exporter protein A
VSAEQEHSRIAEPLHPFIGLVSPYLQLYDEFTARENLTFALAVHGLKSWFPTIQPLLERVQLARRLDDPLRTFSSGMKQRVKYAFALVHRPAILILDEPMANLDANGIELVKHIMREQLENGMLIVATNDTTDVEGYDAQVELGRQQ